MVNLASQNQTRDLAASSQISQTRTGWLEPARMTKLMMHHNILFLSWALLRLWGYPIYPHVLRVIYFLKVDVIFSMNIEKVELMHIAFAHVF